MSDEERETLREKARIYQRQYRHDNPQKVAIWTARTGLCRIENNGRGVDVDGNRWNIVQTTEKHKWIRHKKGFWRSPKFGIIDWRTFLISPEMFGINNAEDVEWIPDYECPLCGSRAWKEETEYCPHCGVKMG